MDGAVGSHLQLISTSNSGLLLSKDRLLLGGEVGEPLRLGDGGGGSGNGSGSGRSGCGRGLLGIHGVVLHFEAVAVLVVLWKVLTIFVSCVAHFISAALFVFSHVWILLEVEEGNEFSRARWLFHAREASARTPLVEFLTESVVLCLDEAEFTRSDSSLTTLGVNEGDGRVNDRALRGATDSNQVWEHCGKILISEIDQRCDWMASGERKHDRLREKATHEEPAIECLTSSALNSIMGCAALGSVCPARRALCGCRLGRSRGRGGRRGLRSLAFGGRRRWEIVVVDVVDGHGGRKNRKKPDGKKK
jgi:hypothetical protein